MFLISKANASYQKKEFVQALNLYQSCLDQLVSFGDPPDTLLEHCKRRIYECNLRISVNASIAPKEAAAATAAPVSVSRINGWTERAYYVALNTDRLPLVSIIIPHYNSGGLIYQALDSIAAQKFKDVETIIVDDVSTDGSLSETRLATYPAWMRLRLVRLESNGGPARSRNVGFNLSQGRGICLLDADDWLDDMSLIERWRIVDSDPNVAAAFSTMTYADAERKNLGTVILKGVEAFSYADFTSNKFPCSALLFRRRSLTTSAFHVSHSGVACIALPPVPYGIGSTETASLTRML
jgi:hypothetical protein